MRSRVVRLGVAGVVMLMLAACSANEERVETAAIEEPVVVTDHLSEAQTKFMAGDFGLAEKSYRAAVETNPNDVEAWLGLAASYDQLRRFDLADKAYTEVLKRTGETAEVLNNIGYSYLLRGDLTTAEKKILAAYDMDPSDPTIRSNVARLDEERAKSRGEPVAIR